MSKQWFMAPFRHLLHDHRLWGIRRQSVVPAFSLGLFIAFLPFPGHTLMGALAALALRVKMTAMPQMVGLFNGFGGLASGLVAAAEYLHYTNGKVIESGAVVSDVPLDSSISIMLGTLIGAVTFSGSLVAFGKLPILYEGRVKPVDTLARNALRKISDRDHFVDQEGALAKGQVQAPSR